MTASYRSRSMRAALCCVWALLLLCLVPLQDASLGDAMTAYARVRGLFLHGYLERSQQQAELGYTRFHRTDPEVAGKFRMLEADAMLWRGMYGDALHVLSLLTQRSKGEDERIQKLTLEGVAYTRLHQFAEAEERMREAEGMCVVASSVYCGEVLRARGVLAVERGHFEQARGIFLKSLSFARTRHDRWFETTALLNLGAAALMDGHYDQAMEWSQSAYQIAAEIDGENLAQVALGNLGWAYLQLGDADRALDYFVKAEDRAVQLGNVRYEIKWLTNISFAYAVQGKTTSARETYHTALLLARKIRSKEDISDILTDLGLVAVAARNADEADAYAKQALTMAQQSGSRPDMLDANAIQAQAAALRGDLPRAEVLTHAIDTAPESQPSMLWAASQALANAYAAKGRIADAQKAYLSALTTFESARADLQQVNSQLPFLSNATPIYDDYIHFLIQQNKPEEALQAADQSRARALAQGLWQGGNSQPSQGAGNEGMKWPSLSLQAVAEKANATLLFYWLGEKQSHLWAITPEKTVLFQLPPQGEITAHVERYRKALTGPEDPLEAANADGLALYSMLVAPAAELLRRNAGRTVAVLTDGALSQLNFETLLVGGAHPHYWIEDATIVAAPSLAMLASAKPSHNASRKMLLIGDPVLTSAEYANLPNAAAEMQMIGRHFDPHEQFVFSRQRATPTAYLNSEPKQFAYIHFVSHGVASRTDPLDSAIILSRPNPATSAAEDSFKLYARDILQSPLDARLVTISACYGSGARTFAGEGLVGLSWAFLRAGAHNTIGALWEASDDSTPRLMDALYQGLAEGQTPAAALRNAKLSLLHARGNFRKPYYWAPFQMYTRL